ncbi:MAG: hypothetical protein HZT40_01355 [Candidatus Thiothrix singaporensis]|uniref:Uncharacterized protein n=1 Tax=Candidatus Thiothrix singaporensis TaxID=2799669 RepID=A0A7L6AMZ8_9GAMM|nr:MAG: hypothetical protein HZT40_01355 [Candidatus Thiothrix singaporensis]
MALVQESEISKDIYHDVLKFQDFLARIRLSIDFEIPSLKKERLRFLFDKYKVIAGWISDESAEINI